MIGKLIQLLTVLGTRCCNFLLFLCQHPLRHIIPRKTPRMKQGVMLDTVKIRTRRSVMPLFIFPLESVCLVFTFKFLATPTYMQIQHLTSTKTNHFNIKKALLHRKGAASAPCTGMLNHVWRLLGSSIRPGRSICTHSDPAPLFTTVSQ